MYKLNARGVAAVLFLSPLVFGCASRQAPDAPASMPPVTVTATTPAPAPATAMPADHQHHAGGMAMPAVTIPPGAIITEADVRFMQGMIAHHGQAVHMSKLATSRGVNSRLLFFATKIDQSQDAEIRRMQEWLHDFRQYVPDAQSWRMHFMPGMLTEDELAQLEKARGVEFEKLFLTLMIRHHEGALKMVADLMATPRAAQDIEVSMFANDVEAVQTAEIGVMKQMLADY